MNYDTIIDQNNYINIIGVTDGSIQSLGSVFTSLIFPNGGIEIDFQVVPKNFPITVDGIIGKDFIKAHKCQIDYFSMLFTIRQDDYLIEVPIIDDSQYYSIPARCEVIRKFTLNSTKIKDQVIENGEIQPGVFVANSIINPRDCVLKILNTNSKPVSLKRILKLKTTDLDEFDILHSNGIKSKYHNSDRVNKLKSILNATIPKHAPHRLLSLCEEYSDIFTVPGDKHTVNNFYKQELKLADNTPVYIKNYRYPHSQKVEISSQIKDMLKNKVIEPSCSNYNSPIIIVPKKSVDGTKKFRLCIDFRQLNKKLIPDKFPLPRIDEILDNLGRTRYFTKLDCSAGFWQIPLEEKSKNMTSFSTIEGSFRFNVLPFGLNVSPNSFARMMSIAFSGLDPGTAFLYIDDVIVVGITAEHHLSNLKKVFDVFRKRNLKLNPQKCEFMRSEVTYLGHRCTDKGILPDSSKYESIVNYPKPNSKDAVKRFVAFCNYYRKFIPNFATIAQPLNALTKKKAVFEWSSLCDEAFKSLKNLLVNPPILQYPDFGKPFIITVDASKNGIGAVLSQLSNDNSDLPVSFASRSFTKGESNKATIEQELLAIHFGIKHFRPYVYGTKFIVRSDHRPLQYLYTLKDPISKLARIRLDLADYDFEIEYIKGNSNVAADALSRLDFNVIKHTSSSENKEISAIRAVTRAQQRALNDATPTPCIIKYAHNNLEIKRVPLIEFTVQKNDNDSSLECSFVIRCRHLIKSQTLSFKTRNENKILGLLFSEVDYISLKKGLNALRVRKSDEIFRVFNEQSFIDVGKDILKNLQDIWIMQPVKYIKTKEEKKDLLDHYHLHPLEGGHVGQKRMYAKLRSKFEWKNMAKDVARYVKNCELCRVNKPKRKNRESMQITQTPVQPFESLIIDTIGPFPSTTGQAKYAITIICDFSKFLIIVPVPNKEAKTIAKVIVENCILVFGPMKRIRSDMGTEFCNQVLRELAELLHINHDKSTAYHHETVGTVERSHKTLNEYLRSYISNNSKDWFKFVKYFSFCFNTTPNSSINMYTPFELVFGRKCNDLIKDYSTTMNVPSNSTIEYVNIVKEHLVNAYTKTKEFLENNKLGYKNYHDKMKERPLNINVNDKVLLVNEIRSKLDPLYIDGFIVINIDANGNAEIENVNTKKRMVVHKNRLRKS